MADHKIGNWYKFEKDGHRSSGNIYLLCSIRTTIYAVNLETGHRFGDGYDVYRQPNEVSASEFDRCVDDKGAFFTLVRDVDEE